MSSNKSILYIGAFELPDKNAAAHRVIANGKIFRALGYEVYYLGVDKSGSGSYTKSTISDGLTAYNFPYPKNIKESYDYVFGISRVKKLISELPIKPEIIIAYNYPSIALKRLNGYCKKNNIRLFGDATEWYNSPLGNILYKMYISFDMYYRMKIVHPQLDGVIAISKYLYDYYKPRMTKVLLLPPLVDILDEKWKQFQSCKPSNAFTLVYAGSQGRGPKDRFDKMLLLLNTIRKTTSIQLHLNVIGITKDDFINLFGINSFPENGDSFVTFKGRLSHIESLQEVKAADYVIFIRDQILRNTAGFPTKFVEAISCGTPVLTNSTSNIVDFLQDGVNGFIINDTSEQTMMDSLVKAMSIGKEDIVRMKAAILNSKQFDYRGYVDVVRERLIINF